MAAGVTYVILKPRVRVLPHNPDSARFKDMKSATFAPQNNDCLGHEPDPESGIMGRTVYCDGSCAHPRKRKAPSREKKMRIFGFHDVGDGAGTMFGFDVEIERETAKAYLLKDEASGRQTWLPKSALKEPASDGSRELAAWAMDKVFNDARFVAAEAYGDVL